MNEFEQKQALKKQCEEAWNQYYNYRHSQFGGPGNGCDDYRDIPDTVSNKLMNLRKNAEKLSKEFKKTYGYEYNESPKLTEEQMKIFKGDNNEEIIKYLEKERKRNQEIKDKDNKIQELEAKLQESENKYKYLLADLENIKKRYNKQIDDLRNYEGENILKEILTIYDNLSLAIEHNSNNEDLKIIRDNLLKLLHNNDVDKIYDKERPIYFNFHYDEAILSKPVHDKQLDNSIDCVHQEGFLFKDKVLRFEKVIVNKYETESY